MTERSFRRDEVAAERRAAADRAMAEARNVVRQLVSAMEGGQIALQDLRTPEGEEVLRGKFVREFSILAALHMGGAAEELARLYFPGEEDLFSKVLEAARRVGWYPRDRFRWFVPRGRKADGTTLVEALRQGLSHEEWEKLASLTTKMEGPKGPASWEELFSSRGERSFLARIVEWSEPNEPKVKAEPAAGGKIAEPAAGGKIAEPAAGGKIAEPAVGGKLAAILGKKPEEKPAGPKNKLGDVAKGSPPNATSDADLAARVASGELSLEEALAMRRKIK